ncbi:MAG: hypothetical protein PHO44_07500 [Sphaerochaetaceae bacterium]|jgi:hypothetical protein|nr:hypothetical protein [Sphaerochaetaceae bacterium]MDD4007811.1 hypothetical protein [Sphaerochaetaceae bacterium]
MIRKALMTILVISLSFACFASGVNITDTPLEVKLSGQVMSEDFTIELVNSETDEKVTAISFDDLSPLNNNGYVVSQDTYTLKYSFVSTSDVSARVVLSVSSKGLTSDNGNSYPIAISFVSEDSDSDNVEWNSKVISVSDTADYEEYQSFRIRLDNDTLYSIDAGHYTGTINFRLVAD